MKKHFILFFLALVVIQVYPQSEDAKNFFKVGSDLFSVPSRFEKKDWLNFAGTAAATGAAFLADEPVKKFSQNNKSPFLDEVFKIDKYYHVEAMGLGIAAIYGYGLGAKKEHTRLLGMRLLESTVYASLINLTTKVVLGRSRPLLEHGNMEFSPLNIDFNTTSFPSGHTTLAFAYSTVLAAEYPGFWWKALWYGSATLVGGARIYHNYHWFSDVVMGAAMGYFVGEFVNHHHTNIDGPDRQNKQIYVMVLNVPL